MSCAQCEASTTVLKNGLLVYLARIRKLDGNLLQQANLTGITYTITDLLTSLVITGHSAISLTIADVVFDTLQTGDPRWDVDETGFSFAHELSNADNQPFPNGGRSYELRYTFSLVGGSSYPVSKIIPVSDLPV